MFKILLRAGFSSEGTALDVLPVRTVSGHPLIVPGMVPTAKYVARDDLGFVK